MLLRETFGLVNGWRKRFFQLKQSKTLLILTSPKDVDKPIYCLDLSKDVVIQRNPEISNFVFSIRTDDKTYLMKAPYQLEQEKWITAFQRSKIAKLVVTPLPMEFVCFFFFFLIVLVGCSTTNAWIREFRKTEVKFEKEGYLFLKESVLGFRKYWFTLSDGLLSWFKRISDFELEPRGSVFLKDVTLQFSSNDLPANKIGFTLERPKRNYVIYGDSDAEVQEWLMALRRQIQVVKEKEGKTIKV